MRKGVKKFIKILIAFFKSFLFDRSAFRYAYERPFWGVFTKRSALCQRKVTVPCAFSMRKGVK